MTERKRIYLEYLASTHWSQLRQRAFERDGWKCKCGSSENLQGHHQRYRKNLELVPLEWIETLCQHCHEAFHRNKARKRRENRRIKKQSSHLTWLIGAFSAR